MPYPPTSPQQVAAIRELATAPIHGKNTPRTLSQIARMVGVCHRTVKSVLQREGLMGRFEMRRSPNAAANGVVTLDERKAWQLVRVEEARAKVAADSGPVWQAALRARLAELATIQTAIDREPENNH